MGVNLRFSGRQMRRTIALAIALLVLGAVSAPAPERARRTDVPSLQFASLSVPSIPEFWDSNNDGNADDVAVTVDADGNS